MDDISIVIITKNEEDTLPHLLESIRKQSINPEVIVSDADSKDATRKIAEKYGCKVVSGGKPSEGRNKGGEEASNNLILFLDSDVILPQGFLKSLIQDFKNRNLDCATTLYKPISYSTIDKFLYGIWNTFALIIQYMKPHAAGFCIACSKAKFMETKFDEDIVLCEDHDFVERIEGKFGIIDEYLLCDVRRLNNDGRLGTVINYIKMGFHRFFRGEIRENKFNYVLNGED